MPLSSPSLPASQSGLTDAVPGIVLAGIVTGAAFSLHEVPGFGLLSPMILAVIIGMLFANVVGTPQVSLAGIGLCQKSLLRLGIVCLGFQVTAGQFLAIGASGIGIAALALMGAFFFTLALGRLLGVERGLTQLIAAGTAICGASAIAAVNGVTRARDQDVAYAVAMITLFGTIAMLALPPLALVLGLDAREFGLWAGASIHEVAQVVGASFQAGPVAGETGTIAKLARVAMLAPMVLLLGVFLRGKSGDAAARPPVPWFIFGFAAAVLLNSLVELPLWTKPAIALATSLLLALGLAGMGLKTEFSQIRALGARPLLLALTAAVFIASLSLMLVKIVG
ncbi:MAG: YeiH family protein [Pseudomonadota bacterium]